MNLTRRRLLLCMVVLLLASARSRADVDPYEQYVKTSEDFKPVKQDKDWLLKAFPNWTYMPWTTRQWTIGYTPESGKWCVDHGINGAFIDWDHVGSDTSKTGKLDWINQFHLGFYVDHAAGKHLLHLWDGTEVKPHLRDLHQGGVRKVPVNDAMRSSLEAYLRKHIAAVHSSPFRQAYALDDEISWGHFVHNTMWCVTDDKSAFPRWLKEIYGPGAPKHDKWITYDDLRTKLPTWPVKDFDASPLLDQLTFNDAYWCDFIGGLVEYANSLDPHTPCGFVGGQSPNAFGGYDYARMMRKIQFIEAYNLGSSQAVIRSFNPHGAIPAVTTHFHRSTPDTLWQVWYYLAHGNRGHIGWVQNWFDGMTPKPWFDEVAPTFLEAGRKIGPLMSGAEWRHDGIGIYYSHPSIQLGWVMDAEAHGKTWTARNGDEQLGASHNVRHAWENMLRDAGLQYSFLSYVDVIQHGVPPEYKVLILPACLCLSDAEARQIEAFCRRGGTVIADYMPGLWDQHGKGRPTGGVLDGMFGVKHDPNMKAGDVFGDRLWCEVDQEANFTFKNYQHFLTNQPLCTRDAAGFNKAVRKMPTETVHRFGEGTAVLMNLSPQWYNAYREQGFESAKKREVFLRHVAPSGVKRWVDLKDAGPREFGYEITYFTKPAEPGKPGRTILFLCANPELTGNELGGGNSVNLKTDRIPITLQFTKDQKGVRNERTHQSLGDGRAFTFDWTMDEAIVLSFGDAPPAKGR